MSAPVAEDATADALVLPSAPDALREAAVGGKAMNLARLTAAGLRVPPFFVVGTRAFRRAVEPVRERIAAATAGRDLTQAHACEAASAQMRGVVLERGREPLVRAELAGLVARGLAGLPREAARPPGDAGGAFLAVRSSCVGEDSAAASFAGQMDTFLFVRGEEAVVDAVLGCWASAFGARALSYRAQQGLDPLAVDAGVVVQVMIPGQVSGVLFTADPTTGRRDVAVVSATWGLGEGLVSGALAADGYTALKQSGELVSQDVQPKERQVVWDVARGSGTTQTTVAPDQQRRPCLAPQEVSELARLGARIEGVYGAPQDVEWTRADGQTYVLQARPITKLPPPPAEGPQRVFDNSNIIESYSGVTTPLTFSWIRKAYQTVYERSCEFNGVPQEEIRRNERYFASLVGLLDGCVYYPMESWYRLLWLFPGAEEGSKAMESMLGVRETARIAELAAPKGRTLWQKVRQAARMLRNFLTIDSIVARFMENFRAGYSRWETYDWEKLSLHDLREQFDEMVQRFLLNWQAPLATDFACMHALKGLEKLTARYGLDDEGAGFQNDLLCGEGGIESTEPTRLLMLMAEDARKDAKLRAALEETPDDACLPMLAATPALAPFHARVVDYLRRYGFRCMNELKLEEPTLRDRPAFLFTMVKNYLRQPDLDVAGLERREKEKRRAAEAKVDARLSFFQRRRYMWWVRQTRKHVKNRENMRMGRTRTYGVLRELLNAAGRRLVERGALDDWRDVYYLLLEEVMGYCDGTTASVALRELAAVRKAEFAVYKARELPDDRVITRGAVHAGNEFRRPPPPPAGDLPPDELRGTPCCPGVVEGVVRVIASQQDDMRLSGEILVAARTDPGWVPLYPSASGLLIERGSLLSHSAIVARELGLPTIVNIPGLIARLKDGQRVRMDAAKGVVKIL